MVANIFQEFTYSRVITNVFLVFVLVGKNFLTPFFPLYLKYLRLSALEAGIICCAQFLSEMILSPIWIFAVRRSRDSHKKRALVVISLLLTSAIYVCFVFVPPAGPPDDVTHCIPQQKLSTILPSAAVNVTSTPPAPNKTTTFSTSAVRTVPQEVTNVPSSIISTTTQSSPSTTTPVYFMPTETPAPPQIYREQDDPAEYPQYGEPVETAADDELTSAKRRPPIWGTWDADGANYYDDPWSGRKLQSFSLPFTDENSWLYSPVFRAAFLLGSFSAALGCLAEPAVSTLWTQRLDDAEHLEQKGEYVVWSRFLTSITLSLLSTLIAFLSPCFVARGLHQTVIHPLAAAGTLAGASILGLILLPLPSGKLPAVPGPPKTRTGATISGIRLIWRGIATALSGAAFTSGTLFLLWHASTLQPQKFRHNYELLYGGFAALEALCAVPVLGWSRSPSSVNSTSPGRAALGLLVLALQFGLTPLLTAPAPLPLLGALQGAGGALLERSLGRAHASSSWRLGCALGALGAGIAFDSVGVKTTMWGSGTLALVAALAVLVSGRTPPSRRRRRAYSRLLLAEAPSGGSMSPRDDALMCSDSEDGESDWLERALREEDCTGASIS